MWLPLFRPAVLGALILAATVHSSGAQTAGERPPATPLIAHNPYFSVWSDDDTLTGGPTRHWTGHAQPLTGLVRVDGKVFRFMGDGPREAPALEQASLRLTPTHTVYTFRGQGLSLTATFFTPAFLDDLDVLSRPVTYLTWKVQATDGAQHQVSLFLEASPEMATSYDGQRVTFSRQQTATEHVLSVGTASQDILNRSGDNLRIDWGYFHLAVPDSETAQSTVSAHPERAFLQNGTLPAADDMEGAVPMNGSVPEMAVVLPMGNVGTEAVERHVLVSYTETFAMQYMNRNLRPYWQRNGESVSAMLDSAEREYTALNAKGTAFDAQLTSDLTQTAGEQYAWLCTLAYREAIAAHGLVADEDGHPMLFAKENFSNGDVGTVDVLYPSAPLFLFFNPKLLEAQLLPVLQYAAMPNRWHFPFAPHDLGQYPLANGQEYGGGEKTEEDQMPVEESGNLLILVDAVARAEGNTALAERFWPLLTQWAQYLETHGLDPETQLTTDDFAGHVAHNANLSIKAIDALEAYADTARLLHHGTEAEHYSKVAHAFARRWVAMDAEGDHYKLAFNSPGTWSQKYNLVWDKILDYNLFPPSVREAEMKFYLTKLNRYGLPLDSRATYTKLDWSMWTATLADSPGAFNALVDPMYKWANETTSRVPMTDWYDTITGKQVGFQARSVVGGLFIKALADKPLTGRWRAKAGVAASAGAAGRR